MAAFLAPALEGFGLSIGQADFLPVLIFLFGTHILVMWVHIWAPVRVRMIHKRLAAMGVTEEQMRGAILVGLSNPANRRRRFAAIQEDMGALWITPDRLVFRGDVEQFELVREQIVEIE